MPIQKFSDMQNDLLLKIQEGKTTTAEAKEQLIENVRREASEIANNSEILNINKKLDYKDLKPLFEQILASTILNTHTHPKRDDFFKIKNTASLQKAIGALREKAYEMFIVEQDLLRDKHEYATIDSNCEAAFKNPIFSTPRQNWFKTFFGMTDSQHKICEYRNRILEEKQKYDNPSTYHSATPRPRVSGS